MEFPWISDIVNFIGNLFLSLPGWAQLLIVLAIAMALVTAEASSNAKRRAAEEEERRQRLKERRKPKKDDADGR